MEADLPVNHSLTIPGNELEVATSRSGGPGGQHVQKTSSRVSLRWNIRDSIAITPLQRTRLMQKLASRLTLEGELLIHVDSERSQIRNRDIARERLAYIVLEALKVAKKRVATKPTRGAKERRIAAKKRDSRIKSGRSRPQMD